jgi:HAD superfamily hydrolase (TIGR01549 family)
VRRSGEALPLRQPPFHEVRANVNWWLDRYRSVGEALGLGEDALARWLALVAEAHFAGDPLRVVPDAPRALARLEEHGILLGVISNWDDTLERILEKKGLRRYFRVLVASTGIGVPKPDRGIFEYALAELGVAAHEAWHVGDDFRADGLGALRAGLSAVLLDPHWMYAQAEAAGMVRARTLSEAVDRILGAAG